VGANASDHGTRSAFLVEGARYAGRTTLFGRLESVEAETALLQRDVVAAGLPADAKNTVLALTVGGVRDVAGWRGFTAGIGADVTLYGVPDPLQPMYSAHPVSFHVLFRLRPPAGAMGRMWNMRMSQPMAGHAMPMNHQMD
jgi:hypothetical protein